MHETRLIRILKTFSENEFKNFGKFIASPYFSTGRDVTPLYKVLKSHYPEFTGKGMEKEQVFSKLGKGKYNEQLMRIMISDLYKLAVEYLRNMSAMEIQVQTKLMLTENALRRRLLFLAEQVNDVADGVGLFGGRRLRGCGCGGRRSRRRSRSRRRRDRSRSHRSAGRAAREPRHRWCRANQW